MAAGLAGVGVHTLAMLAVTAAIFATVYECVGLEVLRTAWLNTDALWVTALVATGMLMLSNTLTEAAVMLVLGPALAVLPTAGVVITL